VLYASADGQYIVQGYLFQLKDGKPVNLTEKTERLGISKLINGIPVAETVVYPAKGETKSHITVFTDTTCPYCHKLHAEVPELNKRGIEVRYVAFPRQGLGSPGDEQLQAVWCSDEESGDGQDGRRQGNQGRQVRQPGFQAVPAGPVDRRERHAGHRFGRRPGHSGLPAGAASRQAGAGQ
jgi:protein-disulfide isomerase